ncbi:ankyrin repeat domain-containing protein [Corticicoccus populi]|uniref:Ankyrin repeat domain-containing protein n=1 Tax=Corticicoccus populi TaxID=1812821 RepID=A0ABW5WSP9_9STAP
MNIETTGKFCTLLNLVLFLISCQNQDNDGAGRIGENIEEIKIHYEKQMIADREEKSQREGDDGGVNSIQTFEAGSLLKAVEANDDALVRLIMEDTDYDINEVNEDGETPLLVAVHNNFIEISEILIDFNADINQQDNISDSPYLYAGAEGKSEILKYMLEHSQPDEKVFNRFGGNALIPAAEKGHLKNVIYLIEHSDSDINHQNNFGYTALIEAVALTDGSEVYQDIAGILLQNGADPGLTDNYGNTAMDYAKQLNYVEMQSLLEKYE